MLVSAFSMGGSVTTVDAKQVWTGQVRRGEMLRQVRGTGRLVPENVRWLTARSEGRVEERRVLSGAKVEPDTIILVLSNPSLEQQLVNAKLELQAAEADLTSTRVRLQSELLAMRGSFTQLQEEADMAQLEAEINRELHQKGLLSELNRKRSDLRAEHLAVRLKTEAERLAFQEQAIEPQLATQQTQVDRALARHGLLKEQTDALIVRAGYSGVLQRLDVEPGMQVAQGSSLAQVADLGALKAVIEAPESQAREISPGQPVIVDTRTSGKVPGIVSRVDPDVRGGYVNVDVTFPEGLPDGCRAEQSVEGAIELERLDNVVYVERPAGVGEFATSSLFRLDGEGMAERVPVRFGRASVSTVEVVEGLRPGDQIILSDTSRWSGADVLRIR